jgi:hypothetical protein
LLVLLSHTVEHQHMAALEIGPDGGSRVKLVELEAPFVRSGSAAPPVVLLLGCDTAVERNEFRSFVAQFLDAGAAIVVGTISPVLGEHAAPVAQALVTELQAAMTNGGNGHGAPAGPGGAGPDRSFGRVMLDIRRRLLAEGEMTALCITSFGDADWRLGEPPKE